MTERIVVDEPERRQGSPRVHRQGGAARHGRARGRVLARLDRIVHDLAPKNRALLAKRDELQAQIDAWHRRDAGQPFDLAAYKAFLAEIGYLVPEGPDFAIDTANVDAEIAPHRRAAAGGAGDQRALRAERRQRPLGRLYDALYGTDAMPEDDGAATRHGLQPGARRQGDRVRARRSSTDAAPLAARARTPTRRPTASRAASSSSR